MAIIFVTKGKTNWKYLLIVFILGLIVGAGSLWLSQNWTIPISQLPEIKKPEKPPKDETAELVPSEVEGWKTYRNEEYGFKFQYPPPPTECEYCEIKEADKGVSLYNTSLATLDPEGLTLLEFIKKDLGGDFEEGSDGSLNNGFCGIRIEEGRSIGGKKSIEADCIDFGFRYIENNKKIYRFTIGAGDTCCEIIDYKENLKIHEIILSTFKFIEKDKNSN